MVLSLGLGLSACSKQWREVDPGADEAEINATIERLAPQVSGFGLDSGFVGSLGRDVATRVYFKRSTGETSYPETVMSFGDVTPFISGLGLGPVSVFDPGFQMTQVSVILLDGFSQTSFGQDRFFVLLLEMQLADGRTVPFAASAGPGDYFFDDGDGVLELYLTGVDGEALTLRTYDVEPDSGGELAANVKFDVFVTDALGPYRIGQFAALAGFGQ